MWSSADLWVDVFSFLPTAAEQHMLRATCRVVRGAFTAAACAPTSAIPLYGFARRSDSSLASSERHDDNGLLAGHQAPGEAFPVDIATFAAVPVPAGRDPHAGTGSSAVEAASDTSLIPLCGLLESLEEEGCRAAQEEEEGEGCVAGSSMNAPLTACMPAISAAAMPCCLVVVVVNVSALSAPPLAALRGIGPRSAALPFTDGGLRITSVAAVPSEEGGRAASERVIPVPLLDLLIRCNATAPPSPLRSPTEGADDAVAELRLPTGFLSRSHGLRSVCFGADVGARLTALPDQLLSGCSRLRQARFGCMPNVTRIGHNFCCGCDVVERVVFGEGAPSSSSHASCPLPPSPIPIPNISGSFPALSQVGDGWLSRGGRLHTVVLGDLDGLVAVGDSWLAFCTALRRLIFAQPLPRLQSVGAFWLYGCDALDTFNATATTNNHALTEVSPENAGNRSCMPTTLSISSARPAFPALVAIGPCFLARSGVRSLVLDGSLSMPRLMVIEGDFLADAPRVERVTLCHLPLLESVGNNCGLRCPRLRAVALHDLPTLADIGSGFFFENKALASVAMERCPRLRQLGARCISGASLLQSVRLDLPALVSVGAQCLHACPMLAAVDLRGLPALRTIGGWFLSGADRLEAIDLSPLIHLEEVGSDFIADCAALRTATVSPLPALRTVGARWLSRCPSLETVAIEDLPQLTTVGPQWLAHADALQVATFRRLPALRTVDEHWLSACPALTTAIFEQLPALATVGAYWLSNCPRLHALTIRGSHSLSKIGHGWLLNAAALEVLDVTHLASLGVVGQLWLSGAAALTAAPNAQFLPTTLRQQLLAIIQENKRRAARI